MTGNLIKSIEFQQWNGLTECWKVQGYFKVTRIIRFSGAAVLKRNYRADYYSIFPAGTGQLRSEPAGIFRKYLL